MNAKDKMNKKNKQGAAFTDDGFAMGRQATGFSLTMHHTVTALTHQKRRTISLSLKYRIAENFHKLTIFAEKTFTDCSLLLG